MAIRRVFVTGATSGIGEALVRLYHAEGADVYFCGRRGERLAVLEKELNATRADSALGFVIDVRNEGDFAEARETLRTRGIRIDTLIANAGMGITGAFAKLTNEDYRRQFETNVYGVMNSIRPFIDDLRENRGRIGIIGSGNAYITLPESSPYCMSKAAVKAFAEALYFELAPLGISVTHLVPGLIRSEIRAKNNREVLNPDYRDTYPDWINVSAEKAAREIRSAVERRKPEAWITGHIKPLLLLEKFLPALARRIKRGIRPQKSHAPTS
jgi:short-subunit dehydrogenase